MQQQMNTALVQHKLEEHLDDDEFVKVFGMDRNTFNKQPIWKKTEQKKKVLLF